MDWRDDILKLGRLDGECHSRENRDQNRVSYYKSSITPLKISSRNRQKKTNNEQTGKQSRQKGKNKIKMMTIAVHHSRVIKVVYYTQELSLTVYIYIHETYNC